MFCCFYYHQTLALLTPLASGRTFYFVKFTHSESRWQNLIPKDLSKLVGFLIIWVMILLLSLLTPGLNSSVISKETAMIICGELINSTYANFNDHKVMNVSEWSTSYKVNASSFTYLIILRILFSSPSSLHSLWSPLFLSFVVVVAKLFFSTLFPLTHS